MHGSNHDPIGHQRTTVLLMSFQEILSKAIGHNGFVRRRYSILPLPESLVQAAGLLQESKSRLILADLAFHQARVFRTLTALRQLSKLQPRIVAFNVGIEQSIVSGAMRAGAIGCLSSDASITELTEALEAAKCGCR
jgi:DNA-binding NarL/FixJ family response regulator